MQRPLDSRLVYTLSINTLALRSRVGPDLSWARRFIVLASTINRRAHDKSGPTVARVICKTAYISLIILLLVTAACSSKGNSIAADSPGTAGSTATSKSTQDNGISTISFAITGGTGARYTINSKQTTSKLRHGHKEFTIELKDAGQSIFLVFYGYNGPGSYTLTNTLNGGDVHIDLGANSASWDLAMQPAASCSLTISSDLPSSYVGLDRMQGTFACPHLPPSHTDQANQAITVSDGQFDILIIVES